jgi:hypothetical protein
MSRSVPDRRKANNRFFRGNKNRVDCGRQREGVLPKSEEDLQATTSGVDDHATISVGSAFAANSALCFLPSPPSRALSQKLKLYAHFLLAFQLGFHTLVQIHTDLLLDVLRPESERGVFAQNR